MNKISTCTEVERKQRKSWQGLKWLSDCTMSIWGAQNTKWTSPFESLHSYTPKPYKVWPHLNLQNSVANTKEFRGMRVNVHHLHFGKSSDGKTNITTLILGENYPTVIYGIAIFEFWEALAKIKRNGGPSWKFTITPNLEGSKCKMNITMMISGSSYPKIIYGMPQIEI